MMLTLTMAAGLLAVPEPQAEPTKGEGWTLEMRGYTYHRDDVLQLLLEGWTIEVGGHTYQLKQPERRKEFIIEFQWPKAKPQREPVEGRYQPVEGQYHDDLSAFFRQWKVQVEGVEAFYADDLPAYIKQLKKR